MDNIKVLILLACKLYFKEWYSFQFTGKSGKDLPLYRCSLVLEHASGMDRRGSGSCSFIVEQKTWSSVPHASDECPNQLQSQVLAYLKKNIFYMYNICNLHLRMHICTLIHKVITVREGQVKRRLILPSPDLFYASLEFEQLSTYLRWDLYLPLVDFCPFPISFYT